MKLKGFLKSLCIFGLTLLPICFTNADQYGVDYYSPFSILSTCTYNTDNSISNNGNFTSYYNSVDKDNILYFIGSPRRDCSPNYFVFGRKNGGLYMFSKVNNTEKQGFLTSFGSCVDPASCTYILNSTGAINFLKENSILGLFARNYSNYNYPFPDTAPNYNMQLCFLTDNSITPYLCFFNQILQDISLTGGLGKNVSDWNDLASWDGFFTKSPFDFTPSIYTDNVCPSIGQLRDSYGLSPSVCYGGFSQNDLVGSDAVYVSNSGLNLFQIYELYSGGVSIQSWYDSMWSMYNSSNQTVFITGTVYSNYSIPSKALLGLMFSRQTFGLDKSSFQILNYCYYDYKNYSDSTSSCVAQNINSEYTGVSLTNQDSQDILDSILVNVNPQFPGSGSIFYDIVAGGGAGGGGGSSWGEDDVCNSFQCLFDKFFNFFNSSVLTEDFDNSGLGILPTYISLAFIISVLYFLLKR